MNYKSYSEEKRTKRCASTESEIDSLINALKSLAAAQIVSESKCKEIIFNFKDQIKDTSDLLGGSETFKNKLKFIF